MPTEKIRFVGNTSIHGADLGLLSVESWHELNTIAESVTYYDLINYPDYYDEFLAAKFIPHTDLSRFPSVAQPRDVEARAYMAIALAVAGKGGIGKTSLAALLIQSLIERGEGPVLAVDADPNPNLANALGCRVEKTISELRNDLLDHIRKLPAGVTKDDYLEMGIHECLTEGQGFDLLAMGAGEGPRCYCAVNSVLRRCVDRLSGAYRYVVMDNEAGLEHLSRCTTQDIDLLLIVSTGHPVPLEAASRIHRLTERLPLRIARQYLVLNDVAGDDEDTRRRAQAAVAGLELLGTVPTDPAVRERSRLGEGLTSLGADSPARAAVRSMLNQALPGAQPASRQANTQELGASSSQ
jgi:CO dehydrogenase maturation factor